jgi:hypothetical protein
VSGKAVRTSNGAGPHNIQLFMLASDGTVLNCLPGFWSAQDLPVEMKFAYELNQVWQDKTLSTSQKNEKFKTMQLAHIQQHPKGMVNRSHMQGFDAQYEAKHNFDKTDTIKDRTVVASYLSSGQMIPPNAFKTTDQIMHERLAMRPFQKYDNFDVASFCNYGLQKYDKHEDARDSSGRVIKDIEQNEPELGVKRW